MHDWKFLLFVLFVFTANAVEALSGFGGVIIAITLGALFYPIEGFLLPVLLPVNFLLGVYIVSRHYRKIDFNILLKNIIPMVGIGFAAGFGVVILLRTLETQIDWLKLVYGVFIVVFSGYQLARIAAARGSEPAMQRLSRAESAFWLAAGGIIHGIYASGGPLITIYASRKIPDKSEFRSTLSALWIVLNLILIVSFIVYHRITLHTLKYSAMLLPALAAGICAGEALHSRIRERTFRIVVFALLFVAGAGLLATSTLFSK
jgi:hypothetical protein